MAKLSSPTIDAAVRAAVQDPYHSMPSALVMAASSTSPLLLSSYAGYSDLPPHPASAEAIASSPVVGPESIYDLWSCSKLICVIAAMQLIEQGVINTEDDATKWVPELRDKKVLEGWEEDGSPRLVACEEKVSVQMLITHTAGFTYEGVEDYDKLMKHLGLSRPYQGDAPRESVTAMALIFQPGSHWNYGLSNDYLTLVIESASGMTLNEYEQKHIFAPLGITDTSYTPNPARISMAHASDTPGEAFTFSKEGFTFPSPHNWGGSGLSGSPTSYLAVLRMLLRGGLAPDGVTRLLRQETVDSMFSPQLRNAQQVKDCQGWTAWGADPFTRKAGKAFEGGDWGYGGVLTGAGYPSGRGKGALSWAGFSNTYWVVDRERDVAFVVWSQIVPFGDQRVFDLWEACETALYEEIDKARGKGGR